MRKFQGSFEKRKRSFICAFSICMTVPLTAFSMCTGKYCPKSQYQPSLLGWLVLMPWEYSPIHIEKTVIVVFIERICLKLTKEKLDCLNFHEIRIGQILRQEKTTLFSNGFTFPGCNFTLEWPCSF